MQNKGYTPYVEGGYIKFPISLFDEVMPTLKPNAWKVLCFIIRKTRGWNKDFDIITNEQMMDGTKISGKDTLYAALSQLSPEYIIIHDRGRKPDGKREPNGYELSPRMISILGEVAAYENHTDNTSSLLIREERGYRSSLGLPSNSSTYTTREDEENSDEHDPFADPEPYDPGPPMPLPNEDEPIRLPSRNSQIYGDTHDFPDSDIWKPFGDE